MPNQPQQARSHGTAKIHLDNQIIVIEGSGPWNLEFFRHLHQQLIALRDKLAAKPYAILAKLHGNALPVAEAIELHSEFIRRGQAVAIAVVLLDCQSKALTQTIFSSIYQSGSLKHAFFEDCTEASGWLEQQLASC